MPDFCRNAADLTGRLFLVILYLTAGIGKIGSYTDTAAYMDAQGVPGMLLPLVILTEVLFSLMVVFGYRTRLAAFLLAGFTILTLIFFHLPFASSDQITFLAELAAAGGFLLLVANGAGKWSIDFLRQRKG